MGVAELTLLENGSNAHITWSHGSLGSADKCVKRLREEGESLPYPSAHVMLCFVNTRKLFCEFLLKFLLKKPVAYVLGGEERVGIGGSGDSKKYSWLVVCKWPVTALATKALTCPSAHLLISDLRCSGCVGIVGLLLEALYLVACLGIAEKHWSSLPCPSYISLGCPM